MEPLELKGTIGLRVSLQLVEDPLASLDAKTKVRHYQHIDIASSPLYVGASCLVALLLLCTLCSCARCSHFAVCALSLPRETELILL